MKALLYKEFKLAVHPLCYIFVLIFPLMVLIPSYPLSISFIYILCTYPILFLGANKGQQSNDLLFTTLLPVRKKDIVLARLIVVSIFQIVGIVLVLAFSYFGKINQELLIKEAIKNGENPPIIPGFGFDNLIAIVSFAMIGYGISDLLYFSIYYKKGKSIVLSSLLTILIFTIFICVFTIIIPMLSKEYNDFFKSNLLVKILTIIISLLLTAGFKIINYKISSKFLEKVDL